MAHAEKDTWVVYSDIAAIRSHALQDLGIAGLVLTSCKPGAELLTRCSGRRGEYYRFDSSSRTAMSTHRIDHVVARATLGRGQFVEEANEISDEVLKPCLQLA